jgi:hypothetical protein
MRNPISDIKSAAVGKAGVGSLFTAVAAAGKAGVSIIIHICSCFWDSIILQICQKFC